MRNRSLRLAAGLVSIGMLAVACGSNRGDSATSGATGATTGAGVIDASRVAGATGAKFGDLASPCGAGSASGATDKGVTDTSIKIGYGDDAGFASAPGLNKEMSEAIRAMMSWCNQQGGINGRKVEGNYYDAKLLEVKSAMTQACTDKVFMLVGQGWASDAAQEDVRIGCQLSSVPTYSVSTAFAHGAGMVQSLANPGDQLPLGFAYQVANLFPDAIKKTALVYANYSATLETKNKVVAGFPAAGYSFLACDQIYNISGESDWKPFASNLKACGAEIVYFVGSPAPNFENFLAGSKQVGFTPKAIMVDANNYDAAFAKWNGDNGGIGDNVYVRMAFVPFEEADKSPATKQYLDLIAKAGAKPSLLGAQATASFLLWATGVKACGSTVTAKCVIAEIGKLKDWTAGGLHVPTQPIKNEAPSCSLLVKLSGAKFARITPKDKTFECDPRYAITNLKTDSVLAAKLDANRVATQFGSFVP